MAIDPKAASSYLQDLPAIFSEDPFVGHFLLAFEQVLTGLPGLVGREPVPSLGVEQIIGAIAKLFNPKASWDDILPNKENQEEFLQWLAGWVALGLRADWTEAQKRDFLANIVLLYRKRGTKENLAELLRIYTGLSPVITEAPETDVPHFLPRQRNHAQSRSRDLATPTSNRHGADRAAKTGAHGL